MAFLIREASLVDSFQSKLLTLPPENFEADNFERGIETVAAFGCRAQQLSGKDAQLAFQEVLLRGFTDGKVGIYSMFHDSAVYFDGYNSEKATRLAYM